MGMGKKKVDASAEERCRSGKSVRRMTVGRGSEDIGRGRILNFAESAGLGTLSVGP